MSIKSLYFALVAAVQGYYFGMEREGGLSQLSQQEPRLRPQRRVQETSRKQEQETLLPLNELKRSIEGPQGPTKHLHSVGGTNLPEQTQRRRGRSYRIAAPLSRPHTIIIIIIIRKKNRVTLTITGVIQVTLGTLTQITQD